MSQTIAEIKSILQGIKPEANIIDDIIILQLINEVDGAIHYDIHREKLRKDIALVAGQAEYSLPEGVTFDLIDMVYVNDEEIPKIDETYKDTTGFLKGSNDNTVKIYPVPELSDTQDNTSLTVVYLKPFPKHTVLNNTVLAGPPYDKMYYEYLSAKISLFKGDTPTYTNMIGIFNASKAEYETWYNERFTNRKG
jgi:hypothetical protein